MSEIVITDAQKEQMETIVVKKLSDEEVKEIMNVKKVERGERCLENFSELTKFGAKIARDDGRIPFTEIDGKPLYNYLEQLEFDDFNEGFGLQVFYDVEKRTEFVDDCREEEDDELLSLFLEAEKHLKELEEKGLKYNENCLWDIRHIITGRRNRYYLERDGNNVDYLIKWYSYIPKRKMKRLQKRLDKIYGREK